MGQRLDNVFEKGRRVDVTVPTNSAVPRAHPRRRSPSFRSPPGAESVAETPVEIAALLREVSTAGKLVE
jgi:hypothetical protein